MASSTGNPAESDGNDGPDSNDPPQGTTENAFDGDDDDFPLEEAPPDGGTAYVWTVPADGHGERLDRALTAGIPTLSRSRLQSLIAGGCVRLAGTVVTDADRRVRVGQNYEITVPAPRPATPEPQAIPLDILYEDWDVIVVNKPPGLVVHPAAGHHDGTLVNALLAHCDGSLSGIGGVCRPGIVHRLDRDTSGLMLAAKTDVAHMGLVAQFSDRTLCRTYRAIVWGVPTPPHGTINKALGRDPRDRKRIAVVSGGKPAITHYRTVQRFGSHAALVECQLETGRTHQIRVHLASVGFPAIGDPLYGTGRPCRWLRDQPGAVRRSIAEFRRQALHAVALRFVHPRTGATMAFTVELPDDMRRLIRSLEPVQTP